MVAIFSASRLTRVAPFIAAGLGLVVALLAAIMPDWRLAVLFEATGLRAFIPAAAPPFGLTARLLLALVSGLAVGLATRAVLRKVAAEDTSFEADGVPVLRRADAHPDAPARRPIRASADLGAPLPIGAPPPAAEPLLRRKRQAVERAIPADLDTPLAAVDPAAIPDVPREPVRAVAPLARQPEGAMESEVFALTPIRKSAERVEPVAVAEPVAEELPSPAHDLVEAPEESPVAPAMSAAIPEPIVTPAPLDTPATVASLLDRLERSAALRKVRPHPRVEETLGLLRGLAVR